jgi:hypothetical protein
LLIVNCKHCQSGIKTFPSRVWRTNFCSDKCRDDNFAQKLQERKRQCVLCDKTFTPRLYQLKTNNGKYCSVKCRNEIAIKKLLNEESKTKSKLTYLNNLQLGLIVHPKGEDHPRWAGGFKESVKRRISSGKANESVKKYRANNPDKVREWSSTRHKRKTGRLPRGTVKNKIASQNGLCVYCQQDITVKYHVDHIIPLSKNGKHEESNIQILCPTCNVKKSAKLNFKLE